MVCNISQTIQILKHAFLFSKRRSWYLATWICCDVALMSMPATRLWQIKNYKRLFMIRIIQFEPKQSYVVSFQAIKSKTVKILMHSLLFHERRNLATVISPPRGPGSKQQINFSRGLPYSLICNHRIILLKSWEYPIFCFLDLTWSAEQLFFP